LGTSTISDALDRFGIAGQCAGIFPLEHTMSLSGPAFTASYAPAGESGGTVGDYIDDVPSGSVVVLDNRARLDATVWGDILTQVAHAAQLAGTAIDGVCRDTRRARDLGYPIFSRGHWMRTGKDRVAIEALGTPVSLGGVRVEQGDWLVGDLDGIVVVPAKRLDDVYAEAARIASSEREIRDLAAEGVRLSEARARLGYHGLQSRR
jgi:regulator of RNase E activity RraA